MLGCGDAGWVGGGLLLVLVVSSVSFLFLVGCLLGGLWWGVPDKVVEFSDAAFLEESVAFSEGGRVCSVCGIVEGRQEHRLQ